MKPLKPPTFLVQQLLITTATTFLLVGFLFSEKILHYWPANWANVTHADQTLPVIIGVIPLGHFFTFISFLCVYLLFELYGLKNAILTTLGLALTLGITFGLMIFLKKAKMDPSDTTYDFLIKQVLLATPRGTLAEITALTTGFSTVFFLSAGIKRLMSNYFMFVRYLIAAPLGLSVFVIAKAYILFANTKPPAEMALYSITPLAQYVFLAVFSLVPLYVARLILGLFRGRQATLVKALTATTTTIPVKQPIAPQNISEPKKKRSGFLFKSAEPVINTDATQEIKKEAINDVVMAKIPEVKNDLPANSLEETKVYELSDVKDDEISISELFTKASDKPASQTP